MLSKTNSAARADPLFFALARASHSPPRVYVIHTDVLLGSVRVALDITPEHFDFTLHTLSEIACALRAAWSRPASRFVRKAPNLAVSALAPSANRSARRRARPGCPDARSSLLPCGGARRAAA